MPDLLSLILQIFIPLKFVQDLKVNNEESSYACNELL